MAKLYNLARMTTDTTGTGDITLGSAVTGHLAFEDAGVSDGETVSYGIIDGVNSEVGRGVYSSSGTTLTRLVLKSTNSDSAIDLSGSAQVLITALAEDFPKPGGPTVQIFTSSGTWTKPYGCVKIKVTIIGGGGGGGGVKAASTSNAIVAGGGGPAPAVIKFLDVSEISSLAVTVGAKGAGGTTAGLTGSTGGTSGVGDDNEYGESTGGLGGSGSATGFAGVYTAQGGATGTASDGDINASGVPSGSGLMIAVNQGASGWGGSSILGGGAPSVRFFANNSGLNGTNATGYGSGGSGAVASGTTSGFFGGDGSDGIVIIEEYYA